MRLLVDANLSPNVAALLRAAGCGASHVADHALASATDEAIAAFAAEHESAILSADSDFATLLAMSGNLAPSLLLLRSADALTPTEQAALLAANPPGRRGRAPRRGRRIAVPQPSTGPTLTDAIGPGYRHLLARRVTGQGSSLRLPPRSPRHGGVVGEAGGFVRCAA